MKRKNERNDAYSVKVDVILLTLNSVKPKLRECLQSLKKEVPVSRLIVVDGGSTDKTLDVCREYFPDCKIIMDIGGTRATSRQKGIEAVQTDLFVFIDSDIVLRSNWFKEAIKSFTPGVGAVQGTAVEKIQPVIQDFEYAMNRLRRMFGGLTYKPYIESMQRGLTVAIKTETVKDIEIPKILHILEDHYIKGWVERKGYIWFTSPTATCEHEIADRSPKSIAYNSFITDFVGLTSLKHSFIAIITIFPKILFALTVKPSLEMAWWQLRFQFWSFLGVLKARLTTKERLDVKEILQFKVGARKESSVFPESS